MPPFPVSDWRFQIDERSIGSDVEAQVTAAPHYQRVGIKAGPVVAAEEYESPVSVDLDPPFDRERVR